MVHAEASTFAAGQSKADVYEQVLEQAKALFEGQRNWVCNLANTSSLLHHALHSLPAPSNATNWTGFYVLYPSNPSILVLGPFHGHVACQTIQLGRGVCGAAAKFGTTQLVRDVEDFPGHIACDGASRSEIVVPIVRRQGGTGSAADGEGEGKVLGVIDVDCAEVAGFDEVDQRYLEQLAKLLAESSDFPIDEVS